MCVYIIRKRSLGEKGREEAYLETGERQKFVTTLLKKCCQINTIRDCYVAMPASHLLAFTQIREQYNNK